MKDIYQGPWIVANSFCSSCFLAYTLYGRFTSTGENWILKEMGMLYNIEIPENGYDFMKYSVSLLDRET